MTTLSITTAPESRSANAAPVDVPPQAKVVSPESSDLATVSTWRLWAVAGSASGGRSMVVIDSQLNATPEYLGRGLFPTEPGPSPISEPRRKSR